MFSLVKTPASKLSTGQLRFRRFGVADFRRRQFLLVLSRERDRYNNRAKSKQKFCSVYLIAFSRHFLFSFLFATTLPVSFVDLY
jgi:hypothetical protein